MKLIIQIKNKEYVIEIGDDKNTIEILKKEIEKKLGIELNIIKLIYKGKFLEDKETLHHYNITENSKIILLKNTKKNNNIEKKDNTPEPIIKIEEEKEKENYSSQINNLINMGYDKEKAEIAINKAKGNFNTALNLLLKEKENDNNNIDNIDINNGKNNNEKNEEKLNNNKKKETNEKKIPNELRNYAIYMKILTVKDEKVMTTILENMKKNNKALLKQINDNEEAFLKILSSPITREDIEIYKNNYFNAQKLLGEDNKKGKVQIFLTEKENEDINDLKEIGYKEEDVIAAYIINDQNVEKTQEYLERNNNKIEDNKNADNKNEDNKNKESNNL